MLLKKIFGPKREIVTRLKKIWQTEELPDLYSLPHITRVIKLRSVRWVGHMACMGEKRNAHEIYVSKHGGKWKT
jgi:hypothetical protein